MGAGAVRACLALHISHFWLSLTYIHLDEVILRIQIHSIEHHAQTYTLHTEQTHTQICQLLVTMNQFVEVESCPFFGLFPLEGSSLTFPSVSDRF